MALTLSHYRFGIDELAESTHGWHANEDTDPALGVIDPGVTFLLRFTLQADGTAQSNVDCEYQYRRNGGTWTNITTTSSVVKAVAATALTNGGNCTKRLSGTGTFESTGAGQTEDGVSGGTANDIVANGNSECECGLQIVDADTNPGDTIDFRLTRDGGTLIDTYSFTPQIIVTGTVNMTGAFAGATTTSGTLKGRGKLSGSAAGVSSWTGTLTEQSQGNLAGSFAGSSTLSGVLKGRGRLAGSTAGTSAFTAALEGKGECIGTFAGASTLSGTLRARGRLAGAVAGGSSWNGTLTDSGAPPGPESKGGGSPSRRRRKRSHARGRRR